MHPYCSAVWPAVQPAVAFAIAWLPGMLHVQAVLIDGVGQLSISELWAGTVPQGL
jgi:hypothetical protein